LSQAPANLVNWQMLEQRGGYAFFVPLLGRWVAQNQPLERVKVTQLARLDPEAEKLYQAAQLAYYQGRDEKAVSLLSRALVTNADHVPARLLLGQILREQDQLPAAIEQYEEAYRRDPPASRVPLVAALLDHGQALEQAGRPAEALAVYERVLEIAPNNATALARRDALKRKVRPQRQPQERRRGLWAALVTAILLLLLCLLCLFFYNPFSGTGPAATATAIAQVNLAATGAAATANAAATATAKEATSSTGQQTPAATVAQTNQQTPAVSSDAAAGESTSQAGSAENAAATATAQAGATSTPTETATPESQLAGEIRVVGSDSMQPLMQQLADAFTAQNPGVQISIKPDTPQASLEAFQRGEADVGMVARELSGSELAQLGNVQLQNVAQNDPVVVVAHILAPVDNLTRQQVQAIFSGSMTNWSQLGGPDAPITVVGRDATADTRLVFEQILGVSGGAVIEEASNRAVRNSVSTQPYAIGYVPLDQVELEPKIDLAAQNWGVVDTSLLEIKVLALDQIEPSRQNANSGAYPITRPFNLVVKNPPDDLVQRWLEFIGSPAGQAIIEAAGHTPAATP
jgi:phosphate transport system substrate-binding protein